jgi:hypothetical protein
MGGEVGAFCRKLTDVGDEKGMGRPFALVRMGEPNTSRFPAHGMVHDSNPLNAD